MAAKARNGEWDELPDLQLRADRIVEQLRAVGGVNAADTPPAEAAAAITTILADFSAARDIIAPWLEQVKPLLDVLSSTRP